MNIFTRAFNKYVGLSAPLKASIWFTICSFLQKGVAFITVPIFTRLLTTEQYGVFSVYNSWYSIISVLATLNLSAGVYNNCMTKYPENRKEVTSAFQGLSTLVTICFFVIYISNITYWNNVLHLSTLFVIFMFLEILFMPAYSFWTVGKRYEYKYIGIVVLTLIISLGSPIIGIIAVVFTEYKAEARVISFVCVQIVVGIIFYIYNFWKGRKFFSLEYWGFALRFNIPLIPHYLSMTVLNQADRIMISRMVSNSAAAVYSIAYSISTIMNLFTNAINHSFIPYTYQALKRKDYEGIRKNANSLLVLVGILTIVVIAFGPELISIVGGSEYQDAVWVIPPIAASVYFMFLYPLFANIEFYCEKTAGIMFASCLGAVCNIVLNYVFIELLGYYAAGYTTLICYIIFVFMHYYFAKRLISKKLMLDFQLYDMKVIVIISIFVLVAMVGMTLTYSLTPLRYSIIILILMILWINRNVIVEQLKSISKNGKRE